MEQAQPRRLEAGDSVNVIPLGGLECRFTARILDFSGRRMGLSAPTAITRGEAVRIEAADQAFLGEVVWCRGVRNAHVVSVELDQVLTGLAALGRMLAQFDEDPSGLQALHAVQDRNNQDRQQPEKEEDRRALSHVSPHEFRLNHPLH